MDSCSTAHQAGGFIASITGYVDCQSDTFALGAWQSLAAPGSTLALVLAGFLTIFVALIGYNLLLGSNFTVRGTTIAFVKIGAVFALSTSWPAYRTVVYDLVTSGPGQIVTEIGPRGGVAGSDGTLVQRLDLTDRALVQLAVLGPGNASPQAYAEVQPPPFVGFDSFALGGSRILFLLSAIAGLSVVRVLAGLLLALGPFFIAFLMFDGTRSLFEGWVRVLAGAALSGIAVSIVFGLELGLTDPWLATVLARRMAGEALPSAPTELFVITCLFAMTVLASIYACMRVTASFRLPSLLRLDLGDRHSQVSAEGRQEKQEANRKGASQEPERTRAALLASSVLAMNRREIPQVGESSAGTVFAARALQGQASRDVASRQVPPLGRSFNRRAGSRVSATAVKRDASA